MQLSVGKLARNLGCPEVINRIPWVQSMLIPEEQ